ncbi:hypothetical protein L1887_33575 [Cichorium endivia]|nr:hypothetical protein L1887_33575 [Cichorium endivia]
MKDQSKSLDRISALPQDTIEKILTHLPIRDALRTSILGPISELTLRIVNSEIIDEIDQIILHLSWRKNIKRFIFELEDDYQLPCSFFSWQGLEHLVLIGDYPLESTRGYMSTFVELFKCLPSVQVVNISWIYTKQFALGGMPQKLPTSLVYLRILVLELCIHEQHELSSILCVINSSPNLEKIKMTMFPDVGERETFDTLVDLQDYSDLKLDHLKELEITSFNNYAPEMEFVKLIMAKSHVLKKARIELNSDVSVDEEVKMLRDLLLLQFPRASPAAKFIIERPK